RPRPGDAQTKLEVRMRSTARGSARGKGRTRKAPSHRRRPSRRARPEGGAELRTTYKVAIVEKCGERCGPRAPRTPAGADRGNIALTFDDFLPGRLAAEQH